MTLAENGQLMWQVPADFDEVETVVIITVIDAAGQEAFHTFTIRILD
jgi:hypothetical protein